MDRAATTGGLRPCPRGPVAQSEGVAGRRPRRRRRHLQREQFGQPACPWRYRRRGDDGRRVRRRAGPGPGVGRARPRIRRRRRSSCRRWRRWSIHRWCRRSPSASVTRLAFSDGATKTSRRLNDAAEEARLLKRAIGYLTKAAGRAPVGARGPSGTISLHTMPLLKASGILYDSTLQARDEPYEVLLEGQPSGIVELPVSAYINDYRFLTSAVPGQACCPHPSSCSRPSATISTWPTRRAR